MLPVSKVCQTGLAHYVARRGQEGGNLVHCGGLLRNQFGTFRLQLLRLALGRRGHRLGLLELRLASAYVSVFLDLFLCQLKGAFGMARIAYFIKMGMSPK